MIIDNGPTVYWSRIVSTIIKAAAIVFRRDIPGGIMFNAANTASLHHIFRLKSRTTEEMGRIFKQDISQNLHRLQTPYIGVLLYIALTRAEASVHHSLRGILAFPFMRFYRLRFRQEGPTFVLIYYII
jgi:hypothetical protein